MKKRKEKDVSAQSEPVLTDGELEMLRSSIATDAQKRKWLPNYDNSDKAKAWRYIKKNKAFAVICVVLALCMLTLLVLGIMLAVKKAEGRENTDDYTVIIGTESYKSSYKSAVRDGVFYIDMYPIAEYTSMTVTGKKNAVKFTASETNYLRFEDGSDTAVINGALVELGGTAAVSSEVCEIPFSFLSKAVTDGLRISFDKETNTVKINRLMYATDKKDEYTPVEICFSSAQFAVLQAIQRPQDDGLYQYSIDVSKYLSSIEPENASEYLILANKQNPLAEDYVPTDLKSINVSGENPSRQLRSDAALAAEVMIRAMKQAGITDTYVTSAYRSYEKQNELFYGYINEHMVKDKISREEAEEKVLTYSARPGTSEHQTGLCVDFITNSMGTSLDERFEATAAFRWLSNNAYKYGFILRYPKDKVDITGYKYEPWHYRFVGRRVATEIYSSGLCLEEYLELN